MAVVFGIYDSDPERLVSAKKRLPKSFTGFPHLALHEKSYGKICLWWEAPCSTPVSHAVDGAGNNNRLAFVIGDYDASYQPVSDAGQRLLNNTNGMHDDYVVISGRNGYYNYLAVVFEESGRLVLGTDVLGYFPLYYWAQSDVFLFGTSPELFKIHPLFQAKPNAYAIASILLISHISGGQALYDGVRRSAPGCLVKWHPRDRPREQSANPLVMSDSGFDRPYDDIKEEMTCIFDSFIQPLANCPDVDFFLSGGQDSRLIAGYADKHLSRHSVQAVSLGRTSDMELTYARKVSRALKWKHRYRDVEESLFPAFALSQIQLESFQGPFFNFSDVTARRLLSEHSHPFLSGFSGDCVMGDKHIKNAFSCKIGLFCFDEIFRVMNRYGYMTSDVKNLLFSQDMKSAVEQVKEGLRKDWDDINGYPFQRSSFFAMTQRQRFHVGSVIWRLSLGAWPLLPYIDRRLLDMVASLPLNYLRDRRIQKDILINDFPKLACLPLDRNAWQPGYLVRPRGRLLYEGLATMAQFSWRLGKLFEQINLQGKKRYYYRTHDFNNSGWQAVRHEADRYRQHCGNIFEPKIVGQLLPRAGTIVHFEDGIIDSSKTKTLAGLVLWNGMRSAGEPFL